MPYDVEVTLTVDVDNAAGQDEAWERVQDFIDNALSGIEDITLFDVAEPTLVEEEE